MWVRRDAKTSCPISTCEGSTCGSLIVAPPPTGIADGDVHRVDLQEKDDHPWHEKRPPHILDV
jgi:hypothetical protein